MASEAFYENKIVEQITWSNWVHILFNDGWQEDRQTGERNVARAEHSLLELSAHEIVKAYLTAYSCKVAFRVFQSFVYLIPFEPLPARLMLLLCFPLAKP